MGSLGYGSLKLFGVSIVAGEEDEPMRKCMSMENLGTFNVDRSTVDNGYVSDGLLHSKRAKENHGRKKGVPWTEDEHRSFLAGLEKLGKGDWKGISRYHVPSRTPTQVASHAQKYFLRLASTDKKRRRSSLFDLSFKQPETPKSSLPEPPLPPRDKAAEISPQASTSAPVATPLAAAQVLLPAASYRAPNFHQMPYIPMVGVTSNGQNFPGAKVFPTVWSVPAMSTFPNLGYFYLPRNLGDFANSEPNCVSESSSSLPRGKSHLKPAPHPSVTRKHGSEPHIGAV